MPVLPENPSTILLAEADTGSSTHLCALLESWNYQVEVIADGAAAFKRLNSPESPALAIVDYELPSMKGLRSSQRPVAAPASKPLGSCS